MQEKLLKTLKVIEKLGNQFQDGDEPLLQITAKRNAFKTIIDYIITEGMTFGNYDWPEFQLQYQKNNTVFLTDFFEAIKNSLEGEQIDDSIPIEVFALFYAYNKSFNIDNDEKLKPIVYVDMDNVLVDFPSAFPFIDEQLKQQFANDMDDIPGIFSKMLPMHGAIEAMEKLYKYFDVYLLSTAPWHNDSAWSDKVAWVKRYLPIVGYKRLLLSHHKNLNSGDYLVDDRTRNGVLKFNGEHIHFGTEKFPDWHAVVSYLLNEKAEKIKQEKLMSQCLPKKIKNLSILYFPGYGGGDHSRTINTLRQHDLLGNYVTCMYYDNNIPAKALADLERQVGRFVNNNHKILLVGNSLGGYWANYFSEKYDLPCVLINPGIFPKESLQKYDTVRKDLLYQYPYSTFNNNKKKRLIFSSLDEVVDNKNNGPYFEGVQSVEWIEQGHKLDNFDAVIANVKKLFYDLIFNDVPVNYGVRILQTQYDMCAEFPVKIECWIQDGIMGFSAIFLREQIEHCSDEKIKKMFLKSFQQQECIISRNNEKYLFVNFDSRAI